MAKTGKKDKWFTFGTLRVPADKTKKSYIVVDKNVEILVGGKKVDLGDYRVIRLTDPEASLDSLLENGYITEEQHGERLAALRERNVRYSLTVPPAAEASEE